MIRMDLKRILQLQNFSVITGIILLFVFGSTALFIHYENKKQKEIHGRLFSSSSMEFVLLERPQKIRFFTISHYYYSYSGHYHGNSFSRIEKVDSDYFHTASPGKNVETRIFIDPFGNLHTLLRDNTIPYGRNFSGLDRISKILFSAGLFFLFAGAAARLYTGSFT